MAVPHESDTCGPVVGKLGVDALGPRWTTMEAKWPLPCALIRIVRVERESKSDVGVTHNPEGCGSNPPPRSARSRRRHPAMSGRRSVLLASCARLQRRDFRLAPCRYRRHYRSDELVHPCPLAHGGVSAALGGRRCARQRKQRLKAGAPNQMAQVSSRWLLSGWAASRALRTFATVGARRREGSDWARFDSQPPARACPRPQSPQPVSPQVSGYVGLMSAGDRKESHLRSGPWESSR